jgi:integrase/recombinase XerD
VSIKSRKQMISRGGIAFAESNTDEIYNQTVGIEYITKRAEKELCKEDYDLFYSLNDQMIIDGIAPVTRYRTLSTLIILTKKLNTFSCNWNTFDESHLRKVIANIMTHHARNGRETGYTYGLKKLLKTVVRFIKTGKRTLGKHDGELPILQFITFRPLEDRLTREDLPTDEEIQKLIATCADSGRDKAMIAVQAEAGTRVGELLNLNIKDFVIDKHGGKIKVDGKTGTRSILLVKCVPYLTRWINDHPFRNNPESPMFIILYGKTFGNRINYMGFRRILGKRVKQAKLSKRIHSHLFRHAEVTKLAGTLTEAESRLRHGWGRKSSMPSKYAHLNQEDLDSKILETYGIKTAKTKEVELKECTFCKITYPNEIRFCDVCSRPLDINDALEMEKESEEKTQAMVYEMMRKEKAAESRKSRQVKNVKVIEEQQKEIQMLKDMVTKMSKAE